MLIHPQEALTAAGQGFAAERRLRPVSARRVVAEHRLGAAASWAIRQSRYFGRAKTKFQLYLAATVANLTRWCGATWAFGQDGGGQATASSAMMSGLLPRYAAANALTARTTMVPDFVLSALLRN